MENNGISLSLNGTPIINDGFVNVDDIQGENSYNQLICHTNNVKCCRSIDISNEVLGGGWYFQGPDGNPVMVAGGNNSFGLSRGHSQIILFRNGQPTQRGRFYCEVVNASSTMQRVYVNICKICSFIHKYEYVLYTFPPVIYSKN